MRHDMANVTHRPMRSACTSHLQDCIDKSLDARDPHLRRRERLRSHLADESAAANANAIRVMHFGARARKAHKHSMTQNW